MDEGAKEKLPNLSAFRQGLGEALMAAAEEHDRDEDEIISPATVESVLVRSDYGSSDWNLTVRTKDGRTFRVDAVEVAF